MKKSESSKAVKNCYLFSIYIFISVRVGDIGKETSGDKAKELEPWI